MGQISKLVRGYPHFGEHRARPGESDLGDLARKYYDVAKVADFRPPDGPPGGQSMGNGDKPGYSLSLRPTTDFFEKG